MNRGIALATAAYLIWGFSALYWIELDAVSPQDIVAHRVVWSFPVVVAALLYGGHLRQTLRLFTDIRTLAILLCSALMQVTNWGIFLWAVVNEQNTQTSLGYFLLPLINVAIGLGIFKERLDRAQTIAIGLAAIGMAILIIENRGLPWVAIGVALSFGLYAAIRKAVSVEAVEGLFVEVSLMLPLALGWLWLQGGAGFTEHGLNTDFMLVGAGLMTVVPLVCFVAGSRLTTLSSLGLVFYLGPSCQLFVAICIFGEPLNPLQLFSFALVWVGLIIVAADSLRRQRNMRILGND